MSQNVPEYKKTLNQLRLNGAEAGNFARNLQKNAAVPLNNM